MFMPAKAHLHAADSLYFGTERSKLKDYLSADATLEEGLAQLDTIPDDYVNRKAVASLRKELLSARKKISRGVATAKKDEAELAALLVVCGREPKPDAWDGGLLEVERFMKNSAHDPSSIDVESCTRPRLTKKCWETTCIVRGSNAFGAKVAQQPTFYVASIPEPSGSVLGMK
jgi:hypothetical protein